MALNQKALGQAIMAVHSGTPVEPCRFADPTQIAKAIEVYNMTLEMTNGGVTVEPNDGRGFNARGLKNADSCWAATEHQAWAMAYGFFKMLEPPAGEKK